MSHTLPPFKVREVVETYDKVLKLKTTAQMCGVARNTVRRIIREKGLPRGRMQKLKESNEQLSKVGTINPKCTWNPTSSKLFCSLQSLKGGAIIGPHLLEQSQNTADLMKGMADELGIGESKVNTLKLEFLFHEYILYQNCLARASAVLEDLNLPTDKKIRLHTQLIEAGHRSMSKAMSVLNELEGTPTIPARLSISQNNINMTIGES